MPAGAGHILVTFGSLGEAQSSTMTTYTTMNQQLADLKSYLAPLVATWEGSAASAYQGHQAKWDSAVTELNAIMQQLSSAVGSALGNYQSTEASNTSSWG